MKKIYLFLITMLVLVGFYFRLEGISTNHSFWADEAHMSSFSRNILERKINVTEALKIQDYQPMQLIVVTTGMAIFGFSEWSARIFSVIFGTVGIIFAFLLTSKLTNRSGGLLAAFLYTFSSLNLAHATQAKQYAALQTIILAILYFILLLDTKFHHNKKSIVILHSIIILLATFATLLHFIGILVWIPYITFLLITYRKNLLSILKHPKYLLLIIVLTIIALFLFKINLILSIFLGPTFMKTFFTHNHFTFYRELLWRNYAFIVLPAIFGILFTFSKHRIFTLGVIFYMVFLSYLWTFKHYTHNIRYLIPLFGLMFVYFGVFWSAVGEKLFHKKSGLTCLLIAIILFAGGYKLTRKPATYYSPNTDLVADVQMANYKQAFSELKKRYPQTDSYVIANDIADVQLWYLNGRSPDALFMKDYTAGLTYGESSIHQTTGAPIYTSLEQFKNFIKNNPRGILIIEDWESILPEEIKQYAKKNLKREIRAEGLVQANGDNWPIEIYSWGMEN